MLVCVFSLPAPQADVQVNDFSKAERFAWYAEGQTPLSDLTDYNSADRMRNQLRDWKKAIPDNCLQELVKQDGTVSNIVRANVVSFEGVPGGCVWDGKGGFGVCSRPFVLLLLVFFFLLKLLLLFLFFFIFIFFFTL